MNSKALQKANEHRAKIVTFYLNGEPFSNHFKITIVAGRNFPNFLNLIDYLNQRAQLSIKYVFNLHGKRISTVDELKHNEIYVCSTTNKFHPAQYGKNNHNQNTYNLVNSRPLSSKHKYNHKSYHTSKDLEKESNIENLNVKLKKKLKQKNDNNILDNKNLLDNKGKVLTIINRKSPDKQSKIFLNIKNDQTFESIVHDLGESVSLSKAKILYTNSKKQIQSFSQLKFYLNQLDTFLVDDNTDEDSVKNLQKIVNLNETKSNSNVSELKNEFEDKFNQNFESIVKSKEINKTENNSNENIELISSDDTKSKLNDNLIKIFDTELKSKNDSNFNCNENKNVLLENKLNKNDKDKINSIIEKNAINENHKNNNKNEKLNDNKLLNNEFKENCENEEILSKLNDKISLNNSINKIRNSNEITFSSKDLSINEERNIENDLFKNEIISKRTFNSYKTSKQYKVYESRLVNGNTLPKKKFRLKRIFGYNGNTISNNLIILPTGELVYFISLFVVLWDSLNKQRFYFDHTEEICCISINYLNSCIASGQKGFYTSDRCDLPIVNIWNYNTLETICTIKDFDTGSHLISLTFSKSGFLAIITLYNKNVQLYYWDWKNNSLIAKESKLLKNEEVNGIIFHPTNEKLLLTYGKQHLNLWELDQENKLVFKKSFKNDFKNKVFTINRLSFLFNDYMISTDSNGTIIVWNENKLKENEINGHDVSISSLLVFPNNYIVTGDVSGVLKTWLYEKNKFNLINIAVLPNLSGSINSLIFKKITLLQDLDYFLKNVDDDKLYQIYIGTSSNMIFSGSALLSTQYLILFQGHIVGVQAIAADTNEKYFYTSGLDEKICKWNKNFLVWSINNKYQVISMAVYPAGGILALGCTNGIICIISTISGEFMNQISLSSSAIGCLDFSPDSFMLAAGTQNGILYVLLVNNSKVTFNKIFTLKCNYPILTLQWSLDCKYILTCVNENDYQELILWDLDTSKFMKGYSILSEKNYWYNVTCTSGDDVRGIWDNNSLKNVINLCCHVSLSNEYIIVGDEKGFIRLFSYPCIDQNASFYECRQGNNAVTEVRFLQTNNMFVSSSFNGAIFVWELE